MLWKCVNLDKIEKILLQNLLYKYFKAFKNSQISRIVTTLICEIVAHKEKFCKVFAKSIFQTYFAKLIFRNRLHIIQQTKNIYNFNVIQLFSVNSTDSSFRFDKLHITKRTFKKTLNFQTLSHHNFIDYDSKGKRSIHFL